VNMNWLNTHTYKILIMIFLIFVLLFLTVGCQENDNRSVQSEGMSTSGDITANDSEIISDTSESNRSEPTLEIGYTDFPPFEYTDGNGRAAGIGIDNMRDVLALLGYGEDDYNLTEYPWTRLMEMTTSGELDIAVDVYFTESRAEVFDYSIEPYETFLYQFMVPSDSMVKFDGNVFNSSVQNIGIVRGYQYGDVINALLDELGVAILEEPTSVDLLDGLIKGRYDVILESPSVAKYYLEQKGVFDQIRILEPVLDSRTSYYVFPKSKNHKVLRDDLDRVTRQLKDDGSYDRTRLEYLK